MDINNAFLNGDLQEIMLMKQPEGFVHPKFPNHVCLLNKALYGLKQAPRAWFEKLRTTLIGWGFLHSKSDSSLFFLKLERYVLFVLIYVDDIIVTGNCSKLMNLFVLNLNSRFAPKDLGQLHHFLGIEAYRDDTGLYLKQERYISSILDKSEMHHSSPVPTPMVINRHFSKNDGKLLTDPIAYRQIIGALQYLTNTRPDIMFAVNKLSQFLSAPTNIHWQALKRILRYLKGTRSLALHIKPSNHLTLQGFSDADWAVCPDDRRSMGGYCVFFGDSLISWSARKQGVVSRSSAESEYRSLSDLSAELAWIQSFIGELGLHLKSVPIAWCDNLSGAALASNPVFHARSKHIELDVHFVRDRVLSRQLDVRYVPSSDQIADLFTKALSHSKFRAFRDKLGLADNSNTRLRGDVKYNGLKCLKPNNTMLRIEGPIR